METESEDTLPFMFLVFEQPGPIQIEQTQSGCNVGILDSSLRSFVS